MSFGSIKLAVIVVMLMAFTACSANGQEFPGLGVSDLWAQNMKFEMQFDAWAARGAWELARQIPNDQPLPFDAMSISRSTSEGMRSFEGYLHNSQVNSNRQLQAIENFDRGAVRGEALYYDSTRTHGPVYLPYGPSAYTPEYEGFEPSQNTFVPAYNPWTFNAWTPWSY